MNNTNLKKKQQTERNKSIVFVDYLFITRKNTHIHTNIYAHVIFVCRNCHLLTLG